MMHLELSRPVSSERPPAAFTVTATPEECRAVALRLNITAVDALVCGFVLQVQGRMVLAMGKLEARVVQECVVTLDPVAQAVRDDFTVQFVPEGGESKDDDPESPDEVTYAGSRIDLGEATVEQLALALDPYPRSVPLEDMGEEEDEHAGGAAPVSPGRVPGRQ